MAQQPYGLFSFGRGADDSSSKKRVRFNPFITYIGEEEQLKPNEMQEESMHMDGSTLSFLAGSNCRRRTSLTAGGPGGVGSKRRSMDMMEMFSVDGSDSTNNTSNNNFTNDFSFGGGGSSIGGSFAFGNDDSNIDWNFNLSGSIREEGLADVQEETEEASSTFLLNTSSLADEEPSTDSDIGSGFPSDLGGLNKFTAMDIDDSSSPTLRMMETNGPKQQQQQQHQLKATAGRAA